MQVDLCSRDHLVTKPESDRRSLDARFQQAHGAGVAKDVRRDPLSREGRASWLSLLGVFANEEFDCVSGQLSAQAGWEDRVRRLPAALS